MTPLALAIITHTPRHLRRTILGVALQSRTPDHLVVACDNHLPEIESLLRACSAEFGLRIAQVRREHQGQCRVSQVRNNAVRALTLLGAHLSSQVVYLDGDCCPAKETLAVHRHAAQHADLTVGFRIELTPEQTDSFDEAALRDGRPPADISDAAWQQLSARDTRYRRQLFLKTLGLCKPHKPKVLSANFSLSLSMLHHVNGFDEEFVGYGAEDDDISRRVYRAGGRAAIVVRDAPVFHQWHPTRAPAAWRDAPGVARFNLKLPFRCARGITHELPQPSPEVVVFDHGSEVDRFTILAQDAGSFTRASSERAIDAPLGSSR